MDRTASPTPPAAATAAAAAACARRAQRAARRRRWLPYLFISPFFILFAVFGLFPLLFSVWMSLHTWDPAAGLGAMQWVGLENYTHTLFNDDWFHRAMWNTLWIALLAGVPQHLVALPLAWFLHTQLGRWRNAVLGLYFLPFITSTVAISLVFGALFSREFGVINQALASLQAVPGLGALLPAQPVDWSQPEHLPTMISAVVFWRYVGWNTVLYLSAMQTIPKDLLEAAAMDGAGPVRRFLHIVLPMLRPMIFFAVTLTIIGNLQLFEEPFILTGGTGGTDQAGMTAAMHLYAVAFSEGDFGTASAIAWLLFLLVAGGTWLNRRLLGREA